jgi:hypothetical protein
MNWPAFLCVSLVLLPANAATTKTNLPMKYEGGTLPLSRGKAMATISGNNMVFSHGRQKVALPLQNLATISCSTDSRRRFGAPVLGVVPLLHLNTAADYYVGLTWAGDSRSGEPAGRIEAVLKLSASEYREFLMTLERLTAKKAVDSHAVPTIVRYGL